MSHSISYLVTNSFPSEIIKVKHDTLQEAPQNVLFFFFLPQLKKSKLRKHLEEKQTETIGIKKKRHSSFWMINLYPNSLSP